jgi:hypothetical protein
VKATDTVKIVGTHRSLADGPNLPTPAVPGIAGDEGLRELNQFRTVCRRRLDQFNRFVHGLFKVEKHR